MKKFKAYSKRIAQVIVLGCCVIFLTAGAVYAQNYQQDMSVLPSAQIDDHNGSDQSTDTTSCDVYYSQENDGETASANELFEVKNGLYTFSDWEEAEATLGLSMGKPKNMLQEKWLLSGMVDNDKRCVYAVTDCEDGKLEIYDSDFGSKEWSFSQSLQDAVRSYQYVNAGGDVVMCAEFEAEGQSMTYATFQDAYCVVQLKFYGVSENKIKETLDAVNFKEYRREK